jgi:hypothetical protein
MTFDLRTRADAHDRMLATRLDALLPMLLDRAARAEDLDGLIYTHPIGLHGHAAGPTIGLWDNQVGVEGQGDYPVWSSTAYSIELQARVTVEEWGDQVVQFMLEEDAWFDDEGCSFLDGRQTEPWLV